MTLETLRELCPQKKWVRRPPNHQYAAESQYSVRLENYKGTKRNRSGTFAQKLKLFQKVTQNVFAIQCIRPTFLWQHHPCTLIKHQCNKIVNNVVDWDILTPTIPQKLVTTSMQIIIIIACNNGGSGQRPQSYGQVLQSSPSSVSHFLLLHTVNGKIKNTYDMKVT